MHVAFIKMKSVITETLVFSIVFRCAETKIRYSTFEQQFSKSTTYNPQVIRRSCLLKPQVGPCRGNIEMYYFNPESRTCDTFRWGGCQGNGNRFDSSQECNETCLSKPNAKKTRPRYCNLSFDYGFCFGDDKRWYYDHIWKVCKETLYSGCGGNKNNFYNLEQCESVCRFAKGHITDSPKRVGSSRKVIIINPLNATSPRGIQQS